MSAATTNHLDIGGWALISRRAPVPSLLRNHYARIQGYSGYNCKVQVLTWHPAEQPIQVIHPKWLLPLMPDEAARLDYVLEQMARDSDRSVTPEVVRKAEATLAVKLEMLEQELIFAAGREKGLAAMDEIWRCESVADILEAMRLTSFWREEQHERVSAAFQAFSKAAQDASRQCRRYIGR